MAGSQLVLPTSNRAGDTATSQAVQTAIASSLLALGPYGQPRRMTVGANKTIKHRVVRALEDVDTIKPDKIAMEIVSRERRLPHVRRSTSNFWGFLGYYCSIKDRPYLQMFRLSQRCMLVVDCDNTAIVSATTRASHPECFKKNLLS